ncbi:hypothetical protein FPOA_04499 [Fusarium poae]|uniref:N-acetyltransferase domain-containing protein n=1 Tax=Fusarium poae TaxID=36050 RepID=A0A1B8AUA4_FUSPO|nr:hypothetical protein FPOA_04499 [Fusarium poae]
MTHVRPSKKHMYVETLFCRYARIQCGWDQQRVEGWKEKQTIGEKCIFWITLQPEDPGTRESLELHFNSFPAEKDPLVDTASSLRGKPRTPLHTKFYPVGHISLDQINEKKGDFLLDLPEEGVYWIKTFYVSKALRNKGIGRAAMDLIESMAIDEPLCAKTLAIDTAQKDTQKRLYREKTGLELASTNQEWYERRFYRLIHTEPNFYTDPKEPPVDAVFLRKDIT